MSKEEILKIVNEMPVHSDEVRQVIWFLEKSDESRAFSLINIFNYGLMLGKQQERARRKAGSAS